MFADRKRVLTVWTGALVLGLLGQGLFSWAGMGVNGALMGFATILVTVAALRFRGGAVSWKVFGWAAPVLAGAVGLAVSDSEMVQALNLAMVVAGCGMMAFSARNEVQEGALMTGVIALFGWVTLWVEGVVFAVTQKVQRTPMTDAKREQIRAVGRGVAIATPLLLVFGVLLVAADPVFARWLTPKVQIDGIDLAMRGFLFLGIAAFGAGFLDSFFRSPSQTVPPRPVVKPMGLTEYGIVFGSLSVLFGAFLMVQARYLFGGSDVVLATEGLTYAEYARRGFFELVAAAALAIPTVLTSVGLVSPKGDGPAWVRGLAVTFLGLVGALLISAATRMGLYVSVYGLTELRLYTSAAMGWMAGLIVVLGFLVLRGQHGRAGRWMVGTAMAGVLVTTAINPDRTIAAVNLSRPADSMTLDTDYLLSLGSGVTEPLLAASDRLSATEGSEIRRRLFDKYGSAGDWRDWTWSESRARMAVREATRSAER